MNKGGGVFRTSSPSQASQDEYAVHSFVTSEGEERGRGENEIISSAENTADIKDKHNNGNTNNIATYKGERLEDKFVSRNVSSKWKSPFCLSV